MSRLRTSTWNPRSFQICSKSACAFPMISRAVCVVASFCSLVASCFSSQAISACSLLSLPVLLPVLEVVFPSRIPASRSLRHSTICEEYRALARR